MFQFIASRAASFICATVLAISAIALLVTCYVVGSEGQASAVTAPPSSPSAVAVLKDAPKGCEFEGNLSCADDMKDMLAKDAFNAYAAGSELNYSDTLVGFMSTYLRTIPSTGKIDTTTEIAIPSQVFPHTFHVFRISK